MHDLGHIAFINKCLVVVKISTKKSKRVRLSAGTRCFCTTGMRLWVLTAAWLYFYSSPWKKHFSTFIRKQGARLLPLLPTDGTLCRSINVSIWTQENTSFFPVRVVKCWHRLPRDVVESPSTEVFKTQLDTVLGNLLSFTLKVLDYMISRGVFQTKWFSDYRLSVLQ